MNIKSVVGCRLLIAAAALLMYAVPSEGQQGILNTNLIVNGNAEAGPAGTVIFMPPFRDPFNFHYDPLIPLKIENLGSWMHSRLVEEGKPGSTSRSAL